MIRVAPRVQAPLKSPATGPKPPQDRRSAPAPGLQACPRPRKAPGRPEGEIVRAILDYLALVPGVTAWRNNTGMAMLPGRGGRPQPVRFGKPGLPDIIGWVRWPQVITDCSHPLTSNFKPMIARFLAIEVKRPGGRPTPEQAAFLELVRKSGGVAIVATAVQDVIDALSGV